MSLKVGDKVMVPMRTELNCMFGYIVYVSPDKSFATVEFESLTGTNFTESFPVDYIVKLRG